MEADPDPSSYLIASSIDTGLMLFSEPESIVLISGVIALTWLLIAFLASFVRTLSLLNGSSKDLLGKKGDPASIRLMKLVDDKNQVQVTLNAVLALASVSFDILAFQLLADSVLPQGISLTVLLASSIAICSFVLILATKVIPRFITMHFSIDFGRTVSGLILPIHRITRPLSRPFANILESSLDYGKPSVRYLSGDDLKAMADMGEAQGTIEEDERELIHSIMDFGDTTVREIMISRLDMDALPITASLEDALNLIQSSGHSRVPLYEDHLDNILGVLYVKDLLPYMSATNGDRALDWRRTARKPFFVPASKPLDDLLREFQALKMHLAIVVDDYGGTAGLVTMEDVLEEIVGDIRDEYDEAEAELHEQIDEYTHIFDARINLDDLSELLKIELDFESYDFETLGGLIFHLKGEIPGKGDEVAYESMTMRIESVENHRIGRVIIKIRPPTADKSLVA